MAPSFFLQILFLCFCVWNSQSTSNTTSVPTPSPTFGCSYTVLPDDRLARGVAVPLYTCLEEPFEGSSIYYECNGNKTHVRKLLYPTSAQCNSDESIVINSTIIASTDFECNGNPCPSATYIDRTYQINADNDECEDGGYTLGIGSYVVNECTFYMNYSAFLTCDRDSITYYRYNGTRECKEIYTNANDSQPNNVKVHTQRIGCQYRINPPIEPNGWISSIRCPGYNYADSSSSMKQAQVITIVSLSIGSLIICIALMLVLYTWIKRKRLTRRYSELTNYGS